jgi:hypothetical protein
MNWSSAVSPRMNLAASVSKSLNSRSRIGITCPGTFSYTSGFSSVPTLPLPCWRFSWVTSSLCSVAILSAAVAPTFSLEEPSPAPFSSVARPLAEGSATGARSGAAVGSMAKQYYIKADWD